MKNLKITQTNVLLATLFVVAGLFSASGQIQLEGYYADGEGCAAWDADGSGPEPYGNGHGGVSYYVASRDYLDNGSLSAGHFLENMTGFETFEQALSDNGFLPGEATFRLGLGSLGEDIMGVDWFNLGAMEYGNWCPLNIHFYLGGEPMIFGTVNYIIGYSGPSTGNDWYWESAYFTVQDISGFSSPEVQAVAGAFILDMDGMELLLSMQSEYTEVIISGNGRSGGFYDITGTFEKGFPTFPFQGMNDDHEGFAGWDADGTGPEPYGNGHNTQLYYGASLDYDDIDPDPAACLGHFLEGSTGFFNTLIQLQYRGYEIGDLKVKLGLESLGPDVQGEDWGVENGRSWCNYYNNNVVFEINGEPILMMLQDTNKLVSMPTKWISETGIGKVYDISQNASPEAQAVAQSFLRDVGTHYLKTITDDIQYVGLFSGNGRDGGIYEIPEGSLMGVHEQATFIPEGNVYGVWTPAGSPYYIDGNLTIENGYTLSIQPGVKVAVRGPYQFFVNGSVNAVGTAEENILFTHSNPNLMWDGFGYDGELADTNALSIFDHCMFENAAAQGPDHENSGGIFAVKDFSSFEIYNSTFRNNLAVIEGSFPASGGAIALWNSSPLIQNCTFYNNVAEYGGAIFSYSNSNPIISNCLFYANYAGHGGALSYYENSSGVLINNTIADNSGDYGGALFFYWHSNPQIINNIIWGNTAVVGNQVYFTMVGPSYAGFYYNDIQGGKEGFYGGASVEYLFNIDEDPAFVGDPDEFPYKIEGVSPCTDMGTPDTSAWYLPEYLPETCICGAPRFFGYGIDMGAFENSITGIDSPAIVEMPVDIYPNPFMESLNISVELEKPEVVSIQIYSTTGARVTSHNYGTLQAGKHLETWNASGLPEGMYYYRLNIGNLAVTKKIIKVR